MRIGRTILAAFIAISVAMVPMAGGAVAKMTDTSASMTLDDGCMHHGKKTGDKAADDCAAMAACALKCFNFAQPISAALTVPQVLMAVTSEPATAHARSLQGLPPFRPPRS
jgi:hypothetical protein